MRSNPPSPKPKKPTVPRFKKVGRFDPKALAAPRPRPAPKPRSKGA